MEKTRKTMSKIDRQIQWWLSGRAPEDDRYPRALFRSWAAKIIFYRLGDRRRLWDQDPHQWWRARYPSGHQLHISLSSRWAEIREYQYRTGIIWTLEKNNGTLCWDIFHHRSRANQASSPGGCDRVCEGNILKNTHSYKNEYFFGAFIFCLEFVFVIIVNRISWLCLIYNLYCLWIFSWIFSSRLLL